MARPVSLMRGFPQPRMPNVYPRAGSHLLQANGPQMVVSPDPVASGQEVLQLGRIRNARQAAQQKYDECMGKIRSMERTSVMIRRKADQTTSRATAKLTTGIASLHNEIVQLRNQHLSLQRKLEATRRNLETAKDTGLASTVRPLKAGFDDFGIKFDSVIKNVDALFASLSSRTKDLLIDYTAFNSVLPSVKMLGPEIDAVESDYKGICMGLDQAVNEIGRTTWQDVEVMIEAGTDRVKGLQLRMETLETNAGSALSQSHVVAGQAQMTQSEFRVSFNATLDRGMKRFNKRKGELKNELARMREERLTALEDVRSRLIQENKRSAKRAQEVKMNQVPGLEPPGRVSKQAEIKELKERVIILREILAEKNGTATKPKPKLRPAKRDVNAPTARVYLRVDRRGRAEVLVVMKDDTVFAS